MVGRSAAKVLRNQELVSIILEHLRPLDTPGRTRSFGFTLPSWPSGESMSSFRSTCYSVARVCKALTEPALDALWADLPDFKHLLFILHAFVPVDDVQPLSYMLRGPINSLAPDWMRFQEYAVRVRRLPFSDIDPTLNSTVLDQLWSMHRKPLLPGLQEFRLGSGSTVPKAISMFISPTLRSVIISDMSAMAIGSLQKPAEGWDRSDCGTREVMDTLGAVAITSFSLRLTPTSSLDTLAVVPRLRDLRVLEILSEALPPSSITSWASVYSRSFSDFSGMCHLHTLTLGLDLDLLFPSSMELPPGPSIFLPSLKSVTARGHAGQLNSLLARIDTHQLSSLVFFPFFRVGPLPDDDDALADIQSDRSSLGDIFTCLETIGRRVSPSAEAVHIQLRFNWEPRTGEAQRPSTSVLDLLRPLLRIKNLRHFTLRISPLPSLSFDNSDVRVMTSAWRHIEELSFMPGEQLKSYPTLSALQWFAHDCRKLRSLTLPVLGLQSLKDLELAHHRLGAFPQEHPLQCLAFCILARRLDLGTETIDKASKHIKRYLRALFPLLKDGHSRLRRTMLDRSVADENGLMGNDMEKVFIRSVSMVARGLEV
ncbi:hypothetical protein EIP91_004117 [Steccherinum ochraceum]|uniref:F-box domain-containing protein n=1 Tax=Steccherinum ochraceum TaxID=92696 RepID=A0A4R0R9C3_9APHY|nr:hypothetical protein EIP91_004117 [Steccherinum ochraceum]